MAPNPHETRRGPLTGPRAQRTQALLYRQRKRRRFITDGLQATSIIRGATDLPTSIVTADVFPDRQRPVSFRCGLEITGPAPAGILVSFGAVSAAYVIWVEGDKIGVRAGGAAGNPDSVSVVFQNVGGNWPPGERIVVETGIVPGSGVVWIWANGQGPGVRAIASGGNLGGIGWAGAFQGEYLQAPGGGLPNDVPPGAIQDPVDFIGTEPLRAFNYQTPREFRNL